MINGRSPWLFFFFGIVGLQSLLLFFHRWGAEPVYPLPFSSIRLTVPWTLWIILTYCHSIPFVFVLKKEYELFRLSSVCGLALGLFIMLFTVSDKTALSVAQPTLTFSGFVLGLFFPWCREGMFGILAGLFLTFGFPTAQSFDGGIVLSEILLISFFVGLFVSAPLKHEIIPTISSIAKYSFAYIRKTSLKRDS